MSPGDELAKAVELYLSAPFCDDPECDCPYKSQWLTDALDDYRHAVKP